MIDEDGIRYRWETIGRKLDERGRRMLAAAEVRTAGWGGLAVVSRITGLDRHPLSRDIILAKLQASRGHLDNLRPEELSPHDQDHYGGLKATDELARQAQIDSGTLVADFCAGLGGTVRYLAYKYGANVTGIEFTPVRVAGAQDLTRRVGLQDVARIVEGNVMDVPLADASVDAVVSQEIILSRP